ncbi:hypothetical protein K0M31_019509 [Melipona bicolor]|uniref:Uncharacterized protein n=1 Tax=Melipona bicolor TaxID=60889 RepID=A0AA40G3G3_9HYME|nr:hypothetical protein K0M31_019509 [Melipona bicolor]
MMFVRWENRLGRKAKEKGGSATRGWEEGYYEKQPLFVSIKNREYSARKTMSREPPTCSSPTIPRLRVSNTQLAQAAGGCAPSVEVLPIFDVKQAACGTPLGMGGDPRGPALAGVVITTTSVVWGVKESLPSAPLMSPRQ